MCLCLVVPLAGCGDDAECGPGTAGPELTAQGTDVTLAWDNLDSGQNNDCPDAMAPSGVVSVTIHGEQVGGPGLLTLCIPRPDRLAGGLPLGAPDVLVIDLNAEAGGCSYAIDVPAGITGTARATGLCDNAADPAGYALTVDGMVTMRRTCGATIDSVVVALSGTAAVIVPTL